MYLSADNPELANLVLTRITDQTEALAVSRPVIARWTDIPYVSYMTNFASCKVPMFFDLYKIACFLGIPFDNLLSSDGIAPSADNIIHWINIAEAEGGKVGADSLFRIVRDKVGLARFLSNLQKDGGISFKIVLKLLSLEMVDFLYIYNQLAPLPENYQGSKPDSLYARQHQVGEMLASSATCTHYDVVCRLMRKIDSIIPSSQIKTKTAFQKAVHLNNRYYLLYMGPDSPPLQYDKGKLPSPSTELMLRAAKAIDISSFDSIIREGIQESAPSVNLAPLKTMPRLAEFLDSIISADREQQIKVFNMLKDPFVMPYSSNRFL